MNEQGNLKLRIDVKDRPRSIRQRIQEREQEIKAFLRSKSNERLKVQKHTQTIIIHEQLDHYIVKNQPSQHYQSD